MHLMANLLRGNESSGHRGEAFRVRAGRGISPAYGERTPLRGRTGFPCQRTEHRGCGDLQRSSGHYRYTDISAVGAGGELTRDGPRKVDPAAEEDDKHSPLSTSARCCGERRSRKTVCARRARRRRRAIAGASLFGMADGLRSPCQSSRRPPGAQFGVRRILRPSGLLYRPRHSRWGPVQSGSSTYLSLAASLWRFSVAFFRSRIRSFC